MGCLVGGLCTGAAVDAVIYFSCGNLFPTAAYAPLALMAVYKSIIAIWPLRKAGIQAKEKGPGLMNNLEERTKQAALLGVCVSPVFVILSLVQVCKGLVFS